MVSFIFVSNHISLILSPALSCNVTPYHIIIAFICISSFHIISPIILPHTFSHTAMILIIDWLIDSINKWCHAYIWFNSQNPKRKAQYDTVKKLCLLMGIHMFSRWLLYSDKHAVTHEENTVCVILPPLSYHVITYITTHKMNDNKDDMHKNNISRVIWLLWSTNFSPILSWLIIIHYIIINISINHS